MQASLEANGDRPNKATQEKEKEVLRMGDNNGTTRSVIVDNSSEFWQLEVMPVSALGRKVFLCFPAGWNSSGWR